MDELLIRRLGAQVAGALADELDGVEQIALVDFPNHPNVGDSAIWLGEIAAIRSLGVRVAYACDQRSYVPEHLRRALGPDGAIVLHGGGNLGDLYPRYQRLRERVLADFPDRRTIQFPQTIANMGPDTERRMTALLDGHRRFSALARDHATLAWFERAGVPARLAPDPAFCLGALPVSGGDGVLWLARTDEESIATPIALPAGVRRGDWPAPSWLWHRRRMLSRRASYAVSALPRVSRPLAGPATGLYGRLAAERVRTGMAFLGSASAVVTDRLHAHILCMLGGIPHVMRDNSTGKLSGFHAAWTHESALAEFIDTDARALARARELAAGTSRTGRVAEGTAS